MKSLSVICITKNEEKHLATALSSVKNLASEIIVVDSGSLDNTLNIAKQFTKNVFYQDWLGYGPQKNFALEKATGDFILHIDADEEVTPDLSAEIKNILNDPKYDFYWLKIITVFLGKPLTHLTGNNLRLFNRLTGHWQEKMVHEQIARRKDNSPVTLTAEDSAKTINYLLHHSHYQTIQAYKERQEKYSTADAKEMLATSKDRIGKKVAVNINNPFSRFRFKYERAIKQFIRKFIKQKGFLDGWQGWLWCFFSAEYEYKMCLKYLKLIKKNI